MPAYLDFMLVFGGQSDAKDPRFSGFREQIRLRNSGNGHSAPGLGRSGKHFQLCYNLKGVKLKSESNEDTKLDEWSIRDAAIYHRFDAEYGTTLWIVTKGGKDLRDRYEELTRPAGRSYDRMYSDTISCFHESLVAHLLYCQWSTEDWRWYIVWLEKVVEQEVSASIVKRFVHADVKSYRVEWQSTESVAQATHTDNTNHGISKICNIGKTKPTMQSWFWRLTSRF
jgi:hypothetical protein